MFVSSYSTYVQPDLSSKESRQRVQKSSELANNFKDSLESKSALKSDFKTSPIPLDYISKAQTHSNKQELEFQKKALENPQNTTEKETKNLLNKLHSHNALSYAKNAYENSSKVFSVYTKQNTTLDQTPKINDYFPQEAKEAKEASLRFTMVNTYIENEKYYQVTA